MFDGALEKVLHMMRLLLLPSVVGAASVQLVGVGGSGKKSAMKLAAFVVGAAVRTTDCTRPR